MMSTMSTVSGLHPPLLHRLLQKGQRYTVYHGLSTNVQWRELKLKMVTHMNATRVTGPFITVGYDATT